MNKHVWPDVRKRMYVLTDGEEIFSVKSMSAQEFDQAQIAANQCTDGNVMWVLASDIVGANVDLDEKKS